ncbi:hypothetical protein [Streptomyces sp. NBC_01618]|uniref:hypothetical protein n=1 Tax=Streptomyces sp. NBC_01618 TaxID=2975900 RepID=UPI00386CD02E|nr:hypothetical protein OH735_23090 [Streptomyces sp. NBC_01618]
MADEHYEWLDKDAAERLLSREPVDSVGGHSCTEAEMLAAALDAAARAARPATGELPGEAAALAAFRTATHSARARTQAANPQAANPQAASPQAAGYADEPVEPPRTGVLGPVHIRPASGGTVSDTSAAGPRRTRPLRWSRPIRFGLAASFAGCALGGVAVAAGTGMLPGPFGEHAPAPATSVSVAATPDELDTGSNTDASPQPPASPEPEPSVPTADSSAPADGRDSGRTGKGDEGGSGEDDRKSDGAGSGASAGTENGRTPKGSGGDTSGEWYANTLKACRDYRDGKLDDDSRRKLEALAEGARNLDRFCDQVAARAASGQNGQNGQGSQDDNGNADDQGDNGNADDQGDDGDSNGDEVGKSRTLPPVLFTSTPPLSSPSLSPSPSASISAPVVPSAVARAAGAVGAATRHLR